MASNDRHNPYKLVVFGSGTVGKSSITLRFVNNTFATDYLATIEDCYRKSCEVDGKSAYLDILDTAGQEEYSALRDQWVREGKAFLLVYSVTSRSSFEEIDQFRERILLVHEEDAAVPIVLVGNKTDLEDQRVVTTEEGQRMAREFQVPFVECSALQGVNCALAFEMAVREIRNIEAIPDNRDDQGGSGGGWCEIL